MRHQTNSGRMKHVKFMPAMTLLRRRFFTAHPELTPEQARRLAAWQALPTADLRQPFSQSRYVVVDVETSGLNLARDHLIAIGAVAVQAGKINLADSLEIVLQQGQASDRDNILIHGIGGTAQKEGVQPAEALLSFLEYLGKSPLIAFHVEFDETMVRRALKSKIGMALKHPWADLAYIAPPFTRIWHADSAHWTTGPITSAFATMPAITPWQTPCPPRSCFLP